MALSQRLEFRQAQALVMTPQLMQAIKLLQLSSPELAAYVEGEIEKNPLLERGADEEHPGDVPGFGEEAGRVMGPLDGLLFVRVMRHGRVRCLCRVRVRVGLCPRSVRHVGRL